MLRLFAVIAILAIHTAHGSDFCAWDRGVELDQQNVLRSYMFLIGEYNRDFTVSSGEQTDTYHGMPYYKMSSEGCTLDELFLYRYLDFQVNPATPHWVISSSVGTTPLTSYAYCGPLSGVSVADLNSPALDACNGNWFIGDPAIGEQGQSANQQRDPYFRVQFGGCPELTCDSLNFCSTGTDVFAVGTSSGGVNCLMYSHYPSLGRPNVYRASQSDSVSGFYYLFFNPKTYSWVIDPELTATKYDTCENYKKSKGFAIVFNAIIEARSPIESSWPIAGNYVSLDLADDSESRRITCSGSIATPSPTQTHAPIPTLAPTDDIDNICRTFVDAGSGTQASPLWQARCGLNVPTAANTGFTSYPTLSPTAAPTTSTATTSAPSSGSISSPSTSSSSTTLAPSVIAPASSLTQMPSQAHPNASKGMQKKYDLCLLCLVLAFCKLLFSIN